MPKLFMLKIGARPKGRLIEQHDMFFGIGERVGDFIEAVNKQWPEVKNAWHLDAYRSVTRVDNYNIEWHADSPDDSPDDSTHNSGKDSIAKDKEESLKLFFINLGGYLPDEFEEFHHKLLIVAATQAQAVKQAKQSEFYKTYSFNDKAVPFNAASHIDDKHQIDVDDIYNINDLLSGGRLLITLSTVQDTESIQEDRSYIGYLSLKKLQQLEKVASL